MDVLLVAHLMVLQEYVELYFFKAIASCERGSWSIKDISPNHIIGSAIAESASLPFTST